MRTSILRTVMLLSLTVMINRNSFGQDYYDEGGNHTFQMNVYRAHDDSAKITTVIYRRGGPLYLLQLRNDQVLSLTVDGRPVPADGFSRYQDVFVEVRIQIKRAEEQAKRDREQAGRDREQAERDREQAGRDREQAERDRVQSMRDRAQAELDRQQSERDRAQAEIEKEQARLNQNQQRMERDQANRDREQAERDRQQADRDRQQAERDREQAERDRIRAEEDRRLVDSLTRDLVADGIVPDRDSIYDLKLNADEVVVNGKRLPEALEKKYLAKYARKGSSMEYHHSN